jgi:hypothetical protein
MNRREFLSRSALAGAALACGAAAEATAINHTETFDPADFQAPRNKFGAARISEQRPGGRWVTVHRHSSAGVIGRIANYGG